MDRANVGQCETSFVGLSRHISCDSTSESGRVDSVVLRQTWCSMDGQFSLARRGAGTEAQEMGKVGANGSYTDLTISMFWVDIQPAAFDQCRVDR